MMSRYRVRSFTIVFLSLTLIHAAIRPPRAIADDEFEPPLSGTIVDQSGAPVTDATISLQGPGFLRTQTDEQGRYEFLDASKPGEYRIEIKSTRWVGITNWRERPRVFISADKPIEKDFTLQRACQIEVQVVDEDDEPLKGVSLYYRALGGQRHGSTRTDRSGAEGRILIGGLKGSKTKYAIGSLNDGYAIELAVFATADVDEIAKHRMVLRKGIQFVGKAICSDGAPAEGWRMVALPVDWPFGVSPGGPVIAKDGTFELANIGEGAYQLSISIPEGDGMSMSKPLLTNVDLRKVKQPYEVKIDMPSPGSMNYLTGKIRWIGKPPDFGFRVSAYCSEIRHHVSHHVKAGTKEVRVGPMPRGTYRVRCDHPDLEVMNLRGIKNLSDLDDVKVPNDKPLQIVLRYRSRPKLRGRVIDEETKKPVEDFRFRVTKLRTLSGPNYVVDGKWRPVRDEQGSWEAQVAGPGVYIISVLADGYAIATGEPINTDEQPDKSAEISVARGVQLSGMVVDRKGQPVDGATVMALSMAAGTMPRTMHQFVNEEGVVKTDHGKFVFENLREGFDSFRATHPEFVFADVKSINVSADSEPVTITLTKGATIQGRVFDQYGQPEPNVSIDFQDDYAYGGSGDREAGHFGQATTDENGYYKISRIPEQTCYVSRAKEWTSNGVVRHALIPEDGKTHELNLGSPARLHGKIVMNGQPMTNTRLQLGGSDSVFGAMKMFVHTNEDGKFTFFGAPPGHWTLYHQIPGTRSVWTKIDELDVPAHGNVDLGVLHRSSGRLTVKCTTNAGQLPEKLQVRFQQYDPVVAFGRDAGRPIPRTSPDDPFQFDGVSTGDYELVAYGMGSYAVREHIKVTKEDLKNPITFHLPVGTGRVSLTAINENDEPLQASFMLWTEDRRVAAALASTMPDADAQPDGLTLPSGRYIVTQGNYRKSPVIDRFKLNDGEDKNVQIVIVDQSSERANGYARLTVTDDQGVFLPCAVKILGDVSPNVQQRRSLINTMLIGPPGEVTIRISHPGFEPIEQAVLVVPQGQASSEQQDIIRIQLVRQRSA